MEKICPNCKLTGELVIIDSVDYINCPDCGWFQVQEDGTMIVCEPPGPGPQETTPAALEPANETLLVPASTSEGSPNESPSSLPSDKPDFNLDEDEDLDEFEENWGNVSVTFED